MGSLFVISGANQGLGLSLVLEAHSRAIQIVAVSKSPRSKNLPGGIEFTQLDCANSSEVRDFWEALARADRESEDIVLINNAGRYLNQSFATTTMPEIEQTLQANFYASIYMSKGFATNFTSGTIVNLNSYAGLHPGADKSVYGAAKAAQAHLYSALRLELPPGKFRIMNLYPYRINSWSDTPEAGTIDKNEVAHWIIEMALLRGSFEIADCTLIPFGEAS